MSEKLNRRGFMKRSAIASASAAFALSCEEKALLERQAEPGKPVKEAPVTGLQKGRIGNIEISRLITGGNLVSGYAHSRDLIYVSTLLRKYFTEEKILETFQISEENGINTVVLNNRKAFDDMKPVNVLTKYWKEMGGKLQWLAQCNPTIEDPFTNIKMAIDTGATGVFIQGQVAESFIQAGRIDIIAKIVSFIKENGLIAGVACHSIEVPIACEREGVEPDFYFKTLHSWNYWSSVHEEFKSPFDLGPHNNIFSTTPEKTIEFMKTVKKPWIAYKVLAAGAIHPKDGFRYSFSNGADFMCVGMFDFQVREDVIITKNVLSKKLDRERPWIA